MGAKKKERKREDARNREDRGEVVPGTHEFLSIFFTVFPPVLLNRPIVYAINLSFHFINLSSVLPWCYSISPSLPLYYLSVSNAYPNAPPTIPTVAPYKWFCSCLPWFYFRASTP